MSVVDVVVLLPGVEISPAIRQRRLTVKMLELYHEAFSNRDRHLVCFFSPAGACHGRSKAKTLQFQDRQTSFSRCQRAPPRST